MSAAPAGFVADSFRWGSSSAPWYETVLVVCLVAAMAIACVLIFRSLRRRERRPPPVRDQWQALAVMSELCPDGWQAQITVHGKGASMPAEVPDALLAAVELEWKQFAGESGRVVVARRLSAPTIGTALQMMVDDRRTDIELEQMGCAAAGEPQRFSRD